MDIERSVAEKPKAPPYVDYHPFKVFLSMAKKQPPKEVNKEYLEQIGIVKSARRMLPVALRSLELINSENRPTLAFTALLKEGHELTKSLEELTKVTYSDLLSKPNIYLGNRPDIARYFHEAYD